MITAVGPNGIARAIELRGESVAQAAPVARTGTTNTRTAAGAPKSPAAELSALGAPVDSDKVSAIREGIANGTYRVDARAIADRMIALDLPTSA